MRPSRSWPARLLALGAGALFLAAATAPAEPPFGLPFAGPPGPGSWLLGQLYGNTTGAYRNGDLWYAAGQGLHFGLDFIVPCDTPVVSLGDGEVVQADWTARGSGSGSRGRVTGRLMPSLTTCIGCSFRRVRGRGRWSGRRFRR